MKHGCVAGVLVIAILVPTIWAIETEVIDDKDLARQLEGVNIESLPVVKRERQPAEGCSEVEEEIVYRSFRPEVN